MKIEARSCPVCNRLLDGACQIEGREVVPEDGDITICIYCGTVSQFAGDELKQLTDEEVYDLPLDGHTRRMLIRARELWEEELKPKFGKQSNVQTRN